MKPVPNCELLRELNCDEADVCICPEADMPDPELPPLPEPPEPPVFPVDAAAAPSVELGRIDGYVTNAELALVVPEPLAPPLRPPPPPPLPLPPPPLPVPPPVCVAALPLTAEAIR